MDLPKGWTELKMIPTSKPDLIDIKARAFLVRLDLMDTNEWFTAAKMFEIEDQI